VNAEQMRDELRARMVDAGARISVHAAEVGVDLIEEWLTKAASTGPFVHVCNHAGTLCGATPLGLDPEGLPFCRDCGERLIEIANALGQPYRRSTP